MPVFRRLAAVLIVGYLAAVVLFYLLAGEQLRFRNSRSNLEMLPADSGTLELAAGHSVEQQFTISIHRLEEINVRWSTYYRQNAGTVSLGLWDEQEDRLLLSDVFDVSVLQEGGLTTLIADPPLENISGHPLALRISSSDGQPGKAASPLMSTQGQMGALLLDGVPVEGSLCLSARGTDYIWSGVHYWEFVAIGFGILMLLLTVIWDRCRKGKHSYAINAVLAVKKYNFLIRQLVSRDFKTKYKRSVLGMFWSFLNPLLTMSVQYIIFSTIFRSDIPNYAVYLLVGVVTFNFFSESCSMALSSIVGNAGLITKVYLPKYIYPLTRVMSSMVNLGISLIPLLLMCGVTGLRLHRSAVLAFYFLVCLVIFSLGLGMFLSAAMVFFRDVQFLWGVLSMIWMYATPIFYPETILPERFRFILRLNPLYHFLKNTRLCILEGISPEPMVYVQCLLIALAALLAGALVFRKSQDKFVLYL